MLLFIRRLKVPQLLFRQVSRNRSSIRSFSSQSSCPCESSDGLGFTGISYSGTGVSPSRITGPNTFVSLSILLPPLLKIYFIQPKMYCIVTLCHLNWLQKIRNWNPHLLFSSRSGTMRPRRLRFPAGRSTSGCHDSSSGSRCRRYSGHYRTVCPDLRKHPDRRSDRSHRRCFRSRQAPFWTGRPY